MGPLLAGLDVAHYEACHHQFNVNLHAFDQVEELLHLLHVIVVWFFRLALLALRDVVDVVVDCRVALLHVEPHGVPPLQRCVQWYSEVLAHHSITKSKILAADHLGTATALLLQLEQVSEEFEVWKNCQIRFIEVKTDRDVQDGVWVEVAQTDSPEFQQIP